MSTAILRDEVQKTLGDSYTLERELGGGGMSHVFVAEEKALGRKIVVKVLPPERSIGVSVERFKREIQVAARLQHPHIVPLLSAGEVNGVPFYTMPFVNGESLRARLTRGGELSVNEALHCLRDVASALGYAHREGVVHRDIKPDNVIISGGVAVVTDFGVSKAFDVAVTEGGQDAAGITSVGVALGTPAYMSPEQASADPHVDHRADIYSFGCLAYELLTGSSPFAGRPPQQMLAAHVTERPEPINKRRPSLPPALATLVMRCLEKRSGDRPQSADEILATLDAVGTPSTEGMVPTQERLSAPARPAKKWLIAGAIGSVTLVLLALLWPRLNRVKPYSVGDTTPVAVGSGIEVDPAISPDGKLVAYVAETDKGYRVFVRQIDGGRANLLNDDLGGDYEAPAWTPDGSRISFFNGGRIYSVAALTGGSPKPIAAADIGSHRWSSDGKFLLLSRSDGIWRQPAEGGEERSLVKGAYLHSPELSPDGQVLAYAEGRPPTFENVSSNSIWTVAINGGEPGRISDSTHVNVSPVWTQDGRNILYLSNAAGNRDIYQQPVTSGGKRKGDPIRLTTSLGAYTISLSSDGKKLAYDAVRAYSNIFAVDISNGAATMSGGRQLTHDNQHIEALELSNDGKWIAFDSDRSGNFDIYKQKIEGGDPIQVTTNPGNDFFPSWSPDDQVIAFHSSRNGTRDLYTISMDGMSETQVTSGPAQDSRSHFSPDGRSLLFAREVAITAAGGVSSAKPFGIDYMTLTRDATGKWRQPVPLKTMRVAPLGGGAVWSADGRQIALLGTSDVHILNLANNSLTSVLGQDSLGNVLGFAWPINRRIYIFARKAGRSTIYVVQAAGGKPRPLLSDEPGARFGRWLFATDGKTLYYTRANWDSDVSVLELKR